MHIIRQRMYDRYAPINVLPHLPMWENEGLNQGIILKFYPQGRGISLANTKLLFSLLDNFVTV